MCLGPAPEPHRSRGRPGGRRLLGHPGPRHQHATETLTTPYHHQLIHRVLGSAPVEQVSTVLAERRQLTAEATR